MWLNILVLSTLLMGSVALWANVGTMGRGTSRTPRPHRTYPKLVTDDLDVAAVVAQTDTSGAARGEDMAGKRIYKTAEQWQDVLSAEQYEIARCGGTERPFSGQFFDHFAAGTYACVCCGTALFDSRTKYETDCGWPSFWAPMDQNAISEIKDISYGMVRTEVICNHCEAHLGHVFTDGPEPTGLRYCINSASLSFVAEMKIAFGSVESNPSLET